jgi:hypothetical protein
MDLHRFLAASAIAGGLLRIVNAFTADVFSPQMLQLAYALTDVLLLLGLAGLLLTWRDELERLGYAGVAVTVIGLTVIRATAFTPMAMDGYAIGATIALIGTVILAADLLWRHIGSRITPLFWIAAFLLGVWSAFGGQAALRTMAGIAFGAGFAVVGIDLFVQRPRATEPA